jgi:hypothetical protein
MSFDGSYPAEQARRFMKVVERHVFSQGLQDANA